MKRNGVPWRLGAVGTCCHAQMRRIERTLKDQHNAARYCELCNETPKAIPGTTPYPLAVTGFVDNSFQMHTKLADPNLAQVAVRYATPEDDMMQVRALMRLDKDALGFVPAGGEEGLSMLVKNERLAVAVLEGRIVGYIALTYARGAANIHQCVVADEYRLQGIGSRLLDLVIGTQTGRNHVLRAKVRNDLAANEFWMARGFTLTGQTVHHSSGNLINHYEYKLHEETCLCAVCLDNRGR